ncbi:MAG: carbonic anhydrase [Nostocaceae cyanobacterium]|nr:carbonic anhydrase [Nostocaceae cyanobacterium]
MPRNLSRRSLVKLSAGAVGAGVLATACSDSLSSKTVVTEEKEEKNITPDQALKKLMEGNQRFVNQTQKNPNQTITRLKKVASGQNPYASILGCADSRVPAEIIFDQGLGDLFVCRVAGNVATPEEIGTLEFGSLILGSKLIMVMGHERCGAVKATIAGGEVPGQIGSLLEAIKPAVTIAKNQPGDKLENICKANILQQVETLKKSPVLVKLIQDKKLKIIGGYYDLDTGKVSLVG